MTASFRLSVASWLLFFALPTTLAESTTTDVPLDTWHSNTGPLTTTFTPEPSCFTERRTKIEYEGAYPNLEVGCEGPGGNECCPDGWASGRYFSPGMCPSGYQACTLPSTRQRQETTNMCCPKHFDCPTRADFGLCRSSLNSEITMVFTDYYSSVQTRRWYALTASPIQIRFQKTDSDVVPIPTDSFNLPPPPTKEELEREEEERRKAEQNKGLSSNAKIGIGVGVALGSVLLIALGWCCCCRGSRRGSRVDSTPATEPILLGNPTSGGNDGGEDSPPPYTKR